MIPSNKDYYSKFNIYWEDTDAGGVVYYANYLKFFERARTNMFREYQINQQELLSKQNIAFVVKKCSVDYTKSAKLDNEIEIHTKVKEVGRVSIIMEQDMRLAETKEILAKMDVKVVCVKNSIPFRIPEEIKNKFI